MNPLQSSPSVVPATSETDTSLILPRVEVVADVDTPIVARPPRRQPKLDPACPPILVADDDPDDTYFIERLLKKTGVKNPIVTFDDGSEVVNYLGSIRRGQEAARHRPPLLLFLDLRMVGLGGFGFLEWARQHKELSPLTIVVLSASADPQDMARAHALGADRYLMKYPSMQTFDSIVRSVYPQTVF
jgi:CheY-like chemotaxis protein